MRRMSRRLLTCLLGLTLTLSLTGCVDQHPERVNGEGTVSVVTENPRIAATSVAVMQICEKLNLDLIGVPHTDLTEIPEMYQNAVPVGSPMSPDMEILSQIQPDWVLSPISLMSDLKPKYEAAGFRYAFLNLKNIQGMFKSIEELGELFHRENEADQLVQEFKQYYTEFQKEHEEQDNPTVLILMGLPGSYVAATENSYVGSLVELAGGINVYEGTEEEFLNVNTEDMLEKDPDIILRTAHAMPDSVMEMFAEEFENNDIWKHFQAVKSGRVYDLPNDEFGMSANFKYQDALNTLEEILYE